MVGAKLPQLHLLFLQSLAGGRVASFQAEKMPREKAWQPGRGASAFYPKLLCESLGSGSCSSHPAFGRHHSPDYHQDGDLTTDLNARIPIEAALELLMQETDSKHSPL